MKLVLTLLLTGANAWAAFDMNQCSFMERDAVNAFVPKDWAKIAIGADLLGGMEAKSPATVGVIDTGLKVAGDPDAGAALLASSPEIDYAKHGTAVSGLIASERYGLDPKLMLHVFPVPGERPSFYVQIDGEMITPPIFRSDRFCAALDKALADSDVRVINLSFSFSASDCVVAAVRKGREAGKIFVYSAGNEGLVSGAGTEGQILFRNDPGVFFVGATNYFGTPASFSNFGSSVGVWAPGTDIPTLGTNGKGISGTSFSAPLVSAYFGKLFSVYPGLKLDTLRALLAITALTRKTGFPVALINPYHGLRLLEAARPCLEKNADDLKCVDEAEIVLQATVAMPAKPETSSCNAYEDYYLALRKNYFLGNGQKAHGDALGELFPASAAEPYLFGATNVEAVKKTRQLEAELTAAIGYYDGSRTRLDPQTAYAYRNKIYADIEAKTLPFSAYKLVSGGELLKRMEPTPWVARNFELFCLGVGGSLDEGCADYVQSAPLEFRMALAQVIAEKLKTQPNATIYQVRLVFDLAVRDYKVKPEADPNYPLFASLFRMALAGWKGKADSVNSFQNLAEYCAEPERLALYEKFKGFREQNLILGNDDKLDPEKLDKWQTSLAWGLSESALPLSEWAQLKKLSIPKDKRSEVGDYIFAAHRAGEGKGTVAEMMTALEALLAKTPDDKIGSELYQYGDYAFYTYAFTSALDNPEVAPVLAQYLLSHPQERLRLGRLLGFSSYHYENGAEFKKLAALLPEPMSSQIIAALADDTAAIEKK